METRSSSHAFVSEIPGVLWAAEGEYPPGPGSGIWDSEPNSVRGSFRADEAEESALYCSLSVSEDGLSDYSETHSYYGSESGSKKSGRSGRGSAGASPLTTASDRSSSYHGTRSLPSPAYLSSGVASSLVASGSSVSASVLGTAARGVSSGDDGMQFLAENGGVSPKRRGQGRVGKRAPAAGRGGGETLRGGWLGRPGQPPPRGQVFQSCLRPGLGSVRTIMEVDEEGWDDDPDEEVLAPPDKASLESTERAPSADAVPKTRTVEHDRPPEDGPSADSQQGKQQFFIRSSSDQSKGGGDSGLGLGSRQRGNSEKVTWAQGRPPVHESPGCLCPVANTPTDGSSVADSPPGSPRGDKLSTMSVYFCGLPGTGYGRRRRSCGLCGRQVARRAPQCSLCRLIVYCDRRCLEQHQAAHFRNCPGASAKRLREAAAALSIAENRVAQADKMADDAPLRRSAGEHSRRSPGDPKDSGTPERAPVGTAPGEAAADLCDSGVVEKSPPELQLRKKGSKLESAES